MCFAQANANALQWQHISSDFRSIRFEQAVVISEKGLFCKKGLKTQKKRTFPANPRLATLLTELKPEEAINETKVFPSPEGVWIDVHNLNNRAWKSVLAKLDGIDYRKLYQTRHSFITAALETAVTTPDGKTKMLDAKDVVKLVGTIILGKSQDDLRALCGSDQRVFCTLGLFGQRSMSITEHYAGQTRELFIPEF